MNKEQIRNGLRLWICSSPDSDQKEQIRDYMTAAQALEDFLNLRLTPNDYLEILAGCNVDVDDYLNILDFNFS